MINSCKLQKEDILLLGATFYDEKFAYGLCRCTGDFVCMPSLFRLSQSKSDIRRRMAYDCMKPDRGSLLFYIQLSGV